MFVNSKGLSNGQNCFYALLKACPILTTFNPYDISMDKSQGIKNGTPLSPYLVNLKSNTMKNTVQI